MQGASHPVDVKLAELAERYGVATEYWNQAGAHVYVRAEVVRAVLRALDVDASTPESIDAALRDADLREWRRRLPPVFVTVRGEQRRAWVHVPHGALVRMWVVIAGERRELEQLDHWVDPVDVDGVLTGEASFAVPPDLRLGWHHLEAETDEWTARTPLVVTPRSLNPDAVIGERQWGFMAQVYATRSVDSWGVGDLWDCALLGQWSAQELGAGFLLVNPLHAAEVRSPITPSPYLPVSRRFANPIYLDVLRVQEYRSLSGRQQRRIAKGAGRLQELNSSADLLDRETVWAAKRQALEMIYRTGRSAERQRAFAEYRRSQGRGLRDFATWCALSDRYGNDFGSWPKKYRHPRNAAVKKFRKRHRDAVRFFMWLQWVTDEQLGEVQDSLREAGMAIGMIHDLAVGVHPEGADAWALQDVLARGVSVGAPPDMYNQMGQDWSQPPWRPDALAEAAFVPYREMLRTVLRHAGGLRIDHVLGLFRMWWIPEGFAATDGTYVRFDFDAMLGIMCLEAVQSGSIVIGEDLGTVEPWVQHALADRGILGTSILWFEAQDSGEPKPPEQWRRDVLASVTVHDLPPTAGFLRDEHVRLRHALNLLTTSLEEETANAQTERQAWAAMLREHGLLEWDVDVDTDEGLAQLTIALHRAIAASPARLLGVALPDIFGDRRAQNQPGTDQEYPNWRIPMTDDEGRAVTLQDLATRPSRLNSVVAAVTGTLPA